MGRGLAELTDSEYGVGSATFDAITGAICVGAVVKGFKFWRAGRAARSLLREGASDVRLWKQLASEELLSEARSGRGMVIAGAGHARRQIDDISRLVDQYGGNADDWAKMSTRSRVADDGTRMSVHWYENIHTRQRVEFKTRLD